MERVNYYVDGYNFYYGLKSQKESDLEWKKFYWLDFVKFFGHFINDRQLLQKVYYFSASPIALDESNRQRILFKANQLLNPSQFEVM